VLLAGSIVVHCDARLSLLRLCHLLNDNKKKGKRGESVKMVGQFIYIPPKNTKIQKYKKNVVLVHERK
jgi:hypothetical protein